MYISSMHNFLILSMLNLWFLCKLCCRYCLTIFNCMILYLFYVQLILFYSYFMWLRKCPSRMSHFQGLCGNPPTPNCHTFSYTFNMMVCHRNSVTSFMNCPLHDLFIYYILEICRNTLLETDKYLCLF